MAEFSTQLQEALDSKGWKAADLARATGISKPTIGKWLKGEYAATQTNLVILSNALQVDIAWLMGADIARIQHFDNESETRKQEMTTKFQLLTTRNQSKILKRVDEMIEEQNSPLQQNDNYDNSESNLSNTQKEIVSHIDPDIPDDEANRLIALADNLKLSRPVNTINIQDKPKTKQDAMNIIKSLKSPKTTGDNDTGTVYEN